MRSWHLLVLIALLGVAAIVCSGCDGDEESDDASADYGTEASDDATDDSEEDMDSGPIPEEQFNQLKEMTLLQVSSLESQVQTLTKINEEHKDAQLAKMLDEIRPRVAALREKLDKATRHDREVFEEFYGQEMTAITEMLEKAQLRLQDVYKEKPGMPQP